MPEMPDIFETTKIASSAFSLMKGLKDGHVEENVNFGNFLIEKAEFAEKDGHEMLHIRVDEDAEFWAIKTKDDKKILALKTEGEYFYYAVTGNNDKQLALVAQDDMVATLKTNNISDNHSIMDNFIQMTEDGKQTDISARIVMKNNAFTIKTDVSEDNKKIAQTNYSSDAKGNVKISGYGVTGAFEGKSKILSGEEKNEGVFFETKVLNGTTIVDNEIWHCENGQLSLVGVINEETDKNTKKIRIAGKDIFYQPASDLPSDELDYIVDKSESNKEEILGTLGGQQITTNDILYGNALRDDLKAQQSADLEQNPITKARQARLGLRLATREQSDGETQDIKSTVSHDSEAQVDLLPQKER